MSDCRGCTGTCCTGVGSDPCTCEPNVRDIDDDAFAFALTTMGTNRTNAGAWADHILTLDDAQARQSATDPAAYRQWFDDTVEAARQQED